MRVGPIACPLQFVAINYVSTLKGIDKVGNQHSCTSEWGPYNLEIVDMVAMPENIPPGPYIVGFRWDCEESNQIWASCSDIDIIG
jgi:hypothetical protein